MNRNIMQQIAERFSRIPAVCAVVLGGSRATGTADASSDLDIRIYYDRSLLDYGELNAAAAEIDDLRRPNLICGEGGWGKWVNFGGWLTAGGTPTDLIFRDIERVRQTISETDTGRVGAHYQTGHPHAFLNVIYRGELALCRPLFVRDADFSALKSHAEEYPEAMRRALMDFFGFEAGFSAGFVQKYAESGDLYYLSGHLFRSVSAMNQLLFALNRAYCLNEKKAVSRAGNLPLAPADYAKQVQQLFRTAPQNPAKAADDLQALLKETDALCGRT